MDQAHDGSDDFHFGVNYRTDIEHVLGQLVLVGGKIIVANQSHFLHLGRHQIGEKTGNQINLIAIGDGQQEVRLFYPGFFQETGIRARTMKGLHVQMIGHLVERLFVRIQDHNFFPLRGQPFGKIKAYFTSSDNNDSQGYFLPNTRLSPTNLGGHMGLPLGGSYLLARNSV